MKDVNLDDGAVVRLHTDLVRDMRRKRKVIVALLAALALSAALLAVSVAFLFKSL